MGKYKKYYSKKKKMKMEYDPYKYLVQLGSNKQTVLRNLTSSKQLGWIVTDEIFTAEQIGKLAGGFVDVKASFDATYDWSFTLITIKKLDPIIPDSDIADGINNLKTLYPNPEYLLWGDSATYVAGNQASVICNEGKNMKKRKYREGDSLGYVLCIYGSTKPTTWSVTGTVTSWLEHK